jgi:hypothetical protein
MKKFLDQKNFLLKKLSKNAAPHDFSFRPIFQAKTVQFR